MITEVVRKVVEQYPYYFARHYTYYREGKEIAKEIFDRAGKLTESVGRIPDGVVKEFYETGVVMGELTYRNGVREGTAREYYESGELLREALYRDGEKDGPVREYFEDGVLEGEWTYAAGRIEGRVQKFYPSGRLRIEKNYRGGLLDGVYRWYYDTGELWKEREYQAGEVVGIPREYTRDGQFLIHVTTMKVTGQYPNKRASGITFFRDEEPIARLDLDLKGQVTRREGTIPDGPVKICTPDGWVSREINYRDGLEEGVTYEYYPNGDLKGEVPFRGGKKDGMIKTYYESGLIREITYFKDGQFFSRFEHVE